MARPVHLIITMMQWIRASRLSIQNSLSEAWLKRKRSAGRRGVRTTATPLLPGRALRCFFFFITLEPRVE